MSEKVELPFDFSKRKLFIALPVYDYKLNVKTALAVGGLLQQAMRYNLEVVTGYVGGCSIISVARNILVREFLSTDCTDLMFIDSDISFTPTDVLRLLAHTTNRDIVGGVPPSRQKEKYYLMMLDETNKQLTVDGLGLLKARRIATAFMMIRREVVSTLIDAHPEWEYKDAYSNKRIHALFDFSLTGEGYIGEDFLFCDRAREHGYSVWIDPTINLGHMGVKEYEGDFQGEYLFNRIKKEDYTGDDSLMNSAA